MKKKDICIYFEYFGDYGMDICNHPLKTSNKSIFDGDCSKCKLFRNSSENIEKCPFCGRKVKLSHWNGEWVIYCNNCSVEMTDKDIDTLIEKWNKRA